MRKEYVPGATFEDAEKATTEEFGRYCMSELSRGSQKVEWVVRFAGRGRAKSTAIKTADGITISLENYWGTTQVVLLIIAYCLCILPGLAMQLQLAVAGAFVNRSIPARLGNMVTTMRRLVAQRRGDASSSPPPLPT